VLEPGDELIAEPRPLRGDPALHAARADPADPGGGAKRRGEVGRPAQEDPMLLMIDNYDSFTYNLVQYLMELGEDVKVERNDAISLDDIDRMRPDRIVISPGRTRKRPA
jgi:hypothetical protein